MDIRAVVEALTNGHPLMARLFASVFSAAAFLDGNRDQKTTMEKYCSPNQLQDSRTVRRLKRDMWYCFLYAGFTFREFFLFGFPRLSSSARRQFVSEKEKHAITKKVIDANPDREIFRDKFKEYQTFKKYYHRDALRADKDLDYKDLVQFIDRHPLFIQKPCFSSCGRGVQMRKSASVPPEQLFQQLRTGTFILEEPIIQCEATARLHPLSVNTVRVATFVKDETSHILFAFFRIGRGDSIVDNAGAGGYAAAVDVETGIITTPGVTEALESAIVHPDTGAQIIGARIPRWEEAKALALELAMVVPAQKYVGWDLALTDSGWVLVEANNAGQFLTQFITQQGIRPLIRQYFDL